VLSFDAFDISETGPNHDSNDDYVATRPELGVFVVADGMGGRPSGDQASSTATECFLEQISSLPPEQRTRSATLQQAAAAANSRVLAIARSDPAKEGMGTTLSAVVFGENGGRVVHIGDSRVYKFSRGHLKQVTSDHTLMAEMIQRNHICDEGAAHHPLRNVLSRCVGTRETVEADIEDLEVRPDDWIVLTTDGVPLEADQLEAVLAGHADDDAETMCRAIMDASLAADPSDNVTVCVVHVGGGPQP